MILHRGRRGAVVVLAVACQLAGVSLAAAQFPPPPGQQQQQASPFPPPPGQSGPAGSPFPPPPGQSGGASPFPPAGGQPGSGSSFSGPPAGRAAAPSGPSPFAPPGAQAPQAGHPCEAFVPIRQEAEKNASAIRAAGDRKASREEVCPLFRRFAASEAKMVAFLDKNQQTCGVPPDAVKTAKTQHAQTLKIRTQVCSAAPAARGPSLSDVLSAPAATDAPKTGSGTFDTLTGNPLSR